MKRTIQGLLILLLITVGPGLLIFGLIHLAFAVGHYFGLAVTGFILSTIGFAWVKVYDELN